MISTKGSKETAESKWVVYQVYEGKNKNNIRQGNEQGAVVSCDSIDDYYEGDQEGNSDEKVMGSDSQQEHLVGRQRQSAEYQKLVAQIGGVSLILASSDLVFRGCHESDYEKNSDEKGVASGGQEGYCVGCQGHLAHYQELVAQMGGVPLILVGPDSAFCGRDEKTHEKDSDEKVVDSSSQQGYCVGRQGHSADYQELVTQIGGLPLILASPDSVFRSCDEDDHSEDSDKEVVDSGSQQGYSVGHQMHMAALAVELGWLSSAVTTPD
ncbi:hypothetical protein JAAARDRAFT_48480 [Jaapia argillacea MUCL 33604]|uniref:Uncharacterized protein n=1 Tax=Jaapia argillacea MUCL 33604 TaxID=933084 RepID=A0A067Q0M8_9AGAM|nr:hypothetical protein JAAARDRAFT_48480 [Jaapia argillacea MUCL 33604]